MEVQALTCPICGSNISRQSMKCDYCLAELIINANGLISAKSITVCHSCGKDLEVGCLFCPHCGMILTKNVTDLQKLSNIRRREKIKQDQVINGLHEKVRALIEKDEFIYFTLTDKPVAENICHTVTEKKLIFFKQSGLISKTLVLKVIPLLDILGIDNVMTMGNPAYYYYFVINTPSGTMQFDQTDPILTGANLPAMMNLHANIQLAVSNAINMNRDVRAQICSLKIVESNEQQSNSTLELLKIRYAKGEITKEQYEAMKKILSS